MILIKKIMSKKIVPHAPYLSLQGERDFSHLDRVCR